MPERAPYPGTPRWVKVLGVVALVVVAHLLVIRFVLGGSLRGGDGPAQHLPMPSSVDGGAASDGDHAR